MKSKPPEVSAETPTTCGSSHDLGMTPHRTYRFTITAYVDAGHVAYDDPEWIADAAAGALANEYGIECVYEHIEQLADGPAEDHDAAS